MRSIDSEAAFLEKRRAAVLVDGFSGIIFEIYDCVMEEIGV